jgi:hypothetical protein
MAAENITPEELEQILAEYNKRVEALFAERLDAVTADIAAKVNELAAQLERRPAGTRLH